MASEYNEWYNVTWKSPKPELQKALNDEWYPAVVCTAPSRTPIRLETYHSLLTVSVLVITRSSSSDTDRNMHTYNSTSTLAQKQTIKS
eukprot:2535795-Rhodomonas_salina.1